MTADFETKLTTRAELAARVAALPKPVVLTNGVFDILHRGHVTYLAEARALGAALVVAVNTDASVKRLGKGDDRPLNTCADRMAVLAALESVSLVVDFAEDTALEVVQEARPEIYAKGGDYDMTAIPEGQAVLAPPSRTRCWRASSSGTSAAPSRGPSSVVTVASGRRTAERCSWTRSPRCRRRPRPSCSACSRTSRSRGSAGQRHIAWTRGSWRRPIGACSRWSRPGSFVRICTTASPVWK